MGLEQAYYTSCEAGLRGTKGFQMNAASSGLSPTDLTYLERYGVYLPPLSCPTMPATPEELALFPRNLAYYKLPDGTAVLSRSQYLGQDYSRRFGNFFTHYVVSRQAAGLIGKVNPVFAWEAPFWVSREAPQSQLPLLESLSSGSALNPETMRTFLAAGDRRSHLPNFLAAVHAALSSRKRLILVEQDEAIARWIALAALALPNSLLAELSFSTYTKNPYNMDVLICGTTADSDFAFSPAEIQHQYQVFDFVRNRFSPPPPQTRFSVAAAEWYAAGDFQEAADFKEFADNLQGNYQAGDLDALVVLYAFIRNQPVGDQEVLDSVNFLIAKGLVGHQDLLNTATAALCDLPVDNRAADRVAGALFSAVLSAPGTGPEAREDATRFYVDWAVQRLLPGATPETFASLAAAFARHRVPPPAWEAARTEIVRWLENPPGAAWLVALIGFLQEVRILPGFEAAVLAGVRTTLWPRLDDPQVQDLLGSIFEAGTLPGLDDLVVGNVLTSGRRPEGLDPLESLLSRPRTRERLKELAARRGETAMVILLTARELAKSSDKAQATVKFLDAPGLPAGARLTAPDLDLLFHQVWRSGMMLPRDARTLLDRRPDLLSHPAFCRLLVQGLLRSSDILNPTGETRELLQKLREMATPSGPARAGQSPAVKLPPEVQGCLELAAWPQRYEAAGTAGDRIQALKRILYLLPPENAGARSSLMRFVLVRYLSSDSHGAKSSDFLADLYALDGELLLASLPGVIETVFNKSSLSPGQWVPLFAFLHRRSTEEPPNRHIDDLYKQILPHAYDTLPKHVKHLLDGMLSSKSDWHTPWETWKKRPSLINKLSGGLLGR
ncbi:MAG: hypothetical protein C4524_11705 [Candidatus Zixiibacteriota bacterium]|nr:MAG: hypothetical protein C4524_11705 [candidate division Zixibacteria bacterium]